MLFIMKLNIKILDIILILTAAAFTFFFAYKAYMEPQESSRVLIRSQEGEWTFPLDAEETVIASGPLGNTVIRIHDNYAWVESSPCQNQTCVAAGTVHRYGNWAACLPNNVLLIIEGTRDEDVDATVW
jgi:hypothetical protein